MTRALNEPHVTPGYDTVRTDNLLDPYVGHFESNIELRENDLTLFRDPIAHVHKLLWEPIHQYYSGI